MKELVVGCLPERSHINLVSLRAMPGLTVMVQRGAKILGTEHFPPGAARRVMSVPS
ncbi:hypothetical protein ACFXBB_36350 [Streptomyces scopuliridis]|uniref:hypothetical protein n=1 Tax=Streptomyces scopuliridis TaxID=452529 RepID=UPI00368C0108